MTEEIFEDTRQNFEFDSDLQYLSFCQTFQDWQYQQLADEINSQDSLI